MYQRFMQHTTILVSYTSNSNSGKDAERVFEEILEVEPREPDAHYHLAEIYLNRYGDVNRAIDCLQYAIERDPGALGCPF